MCGVFIYANSRFFGFCWYWILAKFQILIPGILPPLFREKEREFLYRLILFSLNLLRVNGFQTVTFSVVTSLLFWIIMNITNNEISQSFSVASNLGINTSETSLTGQNNNFLIKIQVKDLSSNYGVAILANLGENHQCFPSSILKISERSFK